MKIEHRRVTRWGSGNTLAITLPMEWIKKHGIKPGMEVRIEMKEDGTILLSPPVETEREKQTIVINGEKIKDRLHFQNVVLGYFLEGYDIIKIEYPVVVPPAVLEVVESLREKMLGFIAEKRAKYIEFSELMSVESLAKLKKHFFRRVIEYVDKFYDAIPKNDIDALQDLVYEPDVILPMYYRCLREMNKEKKSIGEILFLTDFMLVVEELDGLLNTYLSIKTEIPRAFIESIRLISEIIKMLIDTALFGDLIRASQIKNKLDLLDGDIQSVREWGTMESFVGYIERIHAHLKDATIYATLLAHKKSKKK